MKNVLKITATAGATALAIGGFSLAAMTPAVATGAPSTTTSDSVKEQVGAYVYEKIRSHDKAAWTNSGEQRLLIVTDGTEWIAPSIIMEKLPDDVCGPGWAIQQDQLTVPVSFIWPKTITYPKQFGDGAILVDHLHENLEFYGEAPACATTPEPPEQPVTTPSTPATPAAPPSTTPETPAPPAAPPATTPGSPATTPVPPLSATPETPPGSSRTPVPEPTLGTNVTVTSRGTTTPPAAPPATASDQLAETGANTPVMAALAGAGVLALGLGVVALVRNRRRTGSSDA